MILVIRKLCRRFVFPRVPEYSCCLVSNRISSLKFQDLIRDNKSCAFPVSTEKQLCGVLGWWGKRFGKVQEKHSSNKCWMPFALNWSTSIQNYSKLVRFYISHFFALVSYEFLIHSSCTLYGLPLYYCTKYFALSFFSDSLLYLAFSWSDHCSSNRSFPLSSCSWKLEFSLDSKS